MPALNKSGPGMNLMAWQCDDLAGTVEMMKKNGVRVMEDKHTGAVSIHPNSTHGILMQLVEKSEYTLKAGKGGQVQDLSGATGIVSFKCCLVFVSDIDVAVASYEALGLKKHFQIENKANGVYQAGFFLRGGGLIELIGPLDPANEDDGFVKFMKKRGEGFQQMSVDASAGGMASLKAAGINLTVTDPDHCDIDKTATLTARTLLQLNPVGMGQDTCVEDFTTGKPPMAKSSL